MDATYSEPQGDATPISYAVLSLPSKAEMKRKGYDPDHLVINGSEAHPLSRWRTESLPRGATYKDAIAKLQEVNSKPWGLVKVRLHFSDGTEEVFERTNPGVPGSFHNAKTYDPNEVFKKETMARSSAGRAVLLPRLKPIADDKGHSTTGKPLLRTFAPEVLYRDYPPPVHSQPGYDFTPMSHNSFMLRPADPKPGVRNVQSGIMQQPVDYRPRSYLRELPPNSRHCHCAEVYQVGDYTLDLAKQGETIDHKNHLTIKNTTSMGSVKTNSTIVGKRNAQQPRFPCTQAASADDIKAAGDEAD